MNKHKALKKTMALALSLAMVLGMVPTTAFAQGGSLPIGASGEIIAFEPLEDSEKNRRVPLGTSLEDLELPDSLTATLQER